jgi:hypothetical protein
VAPFNFGISSEWWNSNKDKYPDDTNDWFKYGDPEGFGSKAIAPQDEVFDEYGTGMDEMPYQDFYE